LIPSPTPLDETDLKVRAQSRIARFTRELLALSALPPGTDDKSIQILKARIRRERQLVLDLEFDINLNRTMKEPKTSQHATFGHLHIQVTPPVHGTSMWKWAITKVKGGILQKEGFSESREMAMYAAADSLKAPNLKWSEIHI
jgi:hypothetical protein